MDERSSQIREGAGQVESKLNQDFIDWLRKWHMPILLVIAILAIGWVGYKRWEAAKVARIATGFTELDAALSPEALRSVATDYAGIRAVPELARLRAADIYLESARRGLKPGAQPKPETGEYAPEDLLADADRTAMLDQAAALYQQVFDATSTEQQKALHAIGAGYGLAAVAESRGDLDAARKHYESVIKLSEWAGFPDQGKIAQGRIDALPKLAEPTRLLSLTELPKPPEPTAPPALPEQPGPTETPIPGTFDPLSTPAPTPAPSVPPGEPAPAPEVPPATVPPSTPPATPPAAPPASPP